jgi:glycine betaine/proline transport system permease protein
MFKLHNTRTAQDRIIDVLIVALAGVLSLAGISLLERLPALPVQAAAERVIDWLNNNFEPVFATISFVIERVLGPIEGILTALPALVLITAAAVLSYRLSGWRTSAFIVLALIIIHAMGYWSAAMATLSLVLTSAILSLVIGVPLGILKAHSRTCTLLLEPMLDFMQTMPLFVYLIPAVLFFQIGNVPGIVATFIFATPPAVRLTSLGIEQIEKSMLEAGRAFGASPWQLLYKVELPLAMPSIMAGVNQTIMLSLSMVVVASMIGAEGLGQEVYRGITRLNVGQGIASGIGIVLLAMILDRITRALWRGTQRG